LICFLHQTLQFTIKTYPLHLSEHAFLIFDSFHPKSRTLTEKVAPHLEEMKSNSSLGRQSSTSNMTGASIKAMSTIKQPFHTSSRWNQTGIIHWFSSSQRYPHFFVLINFSSIPWFFAFNLWAIFLIRYQIWELVVDNLTYFSKGKWLSMPSTSTSKQEGSRFLIMR